MRTPAPLVVVGEALVDLVLAPGATTPSAHPGGSPANVALGLARLGADVVLVTRLGSDEYGQLIEKHLRGSGVELAEGSVVDAPTSTALARLDDLGRATYEFDIDWRLEAVSVPVGVCLHTGSIAAVLDPGAGSVAALLDDARATATVSYDPNTRPSLMGAAEVALRRIEAVVDVSDIVKASDEDLGWLFRGEQVAAVAARWLARGPAMVVVTRGEFGAYAVAASGEVDHPGEKIDVVDTVGAGDAFSSGLLDGLRRHGLLGADRRDGLYAIDEETLTAVVDRGIRVSAWTCTRPGADPPTADELDNQPLF
jgi:fructokinase